MTTSKDIEKQIEALKKKAERIRQKEQLAQQLNAAHHAKVAEIRALMEQHGITLAELGGAPAKAAKKSSRPPVLPKYKDPATGQTWSGRGRAPLWVLKAESEGKSRASLAI